MKLIASVTWGGFTTLGKGKIKAECFLSAPMPNPGEAVLGAVPCCVAEDATSSECKTRLRANSI